jgi:predicted amidohydrolase
MSRTIPIEASPLGPIARGDSRPTVVKRMVDLLQRAKSRVCELVVFPERALTTNFPHGSSPNKQSRQFLCVTDTKPRNATAF